jgi:sigma-70-like protein
MWLACYTQEEIGKALGVTQGRISQLLLEKENFRFLIKVGQLREIDQDGKHETERMDMIEMENRAAAEHGSDFDIPIYDVWKLQEKTNESSHFGNSEVRWVDNLLYLYTSRGAMRPTPRLSACSVRARSCHPRHSRQFLNFYQKRKIFRL